MKEKIIIASDHGGFELKEEIKFFLKNDYEIVDLGTDSSESCDYPVFAKKLCKKILNKEAKRGILICGTGLGMQIMANRYKGIRAAAVSETYSAKMSRQHNNSNVLCLGGRVLGFGLAKEIVQIWLNTEFLGSYHQRRIDMLDK